MQEELKSCFCSTIIYKHVKQNRSEAFPVFTKFCLRTVLWNLYCIHNIQSFLHFQQSKRGRVEIYWSISWWECENALVWVLGLFLSSSWWRDQCMTIALIIVKAGLWQEFSTSRGRRKDSRKTYYLGISIRDLMYQVDAAERSCAWVNQTGLSWEVRWPQQKFAWSEPQKRSAGASALGNEKTPSVERKRRSERAK